MSRREARESDAKRHHSKLERESRFPHISVIAIRNRMNSISAFYQKIASATEPYGMINSSTFTVLSSPKRARRDGKPATERTSSNHNLDTGNLTDRDQGHRRRLQDALPLEAPLAADSKVGTDVAKTELDKKTSGLHDGTKHSSGRAEVPRSRSYNLDTGNLTDRDQRHRRRLQDPLPPEAPLVADSKMVTEVAKTELDKKTSGLHDDTKHSSDQTEVPRVLDMIQELSQVGEVPLLTCVGLRHSTDSVAMKETEHGRRSDSKDQSGARAVDKMGPYDMEQRDERTQTRVDDNSIWRHDGFFQLEADAPPPARKRPAFREKKVPVDPENSSIAVSESIRPSHLDRPLSGNERREERGGRYSRDLGRLDRPLTGERAPPRRGEEQRVGFPSRERSSGGSGFRGRERLIGRHGERNQYSSTPHFRVEKWKHDLFDEANRSPTPKNEEDQIAKVEALLAL
ncbi:hypothetical protein HHK36_002743 [Tetracentron sinense]|uniref:Uncharacterized protein n=1 Tax=Tetracentron sinense TaxID=13715 RepID=A0A834ZQY5_TETSI|nr:hypothetical protein HHK36_002743 [Tetracentron sinense]